MRQKSEARPTTCATGKCARYHDLNWTQMLAPAYVIYYREGDGVHPVWINGQSGHVAVLALIGTMLVAPLVIGALMIVIAILLGFAALMPTIWVWFTNRRIRTQQR